MCSSYSRHSRSLPNINTQEEKWKMLRAPKPPYNKRDPRISHCEACSKWSHTEEQEDILKDRHSCSKNCICFFPDVCWAKLIGSLILQRPWGAGANKVVSH